MSANKTALTLSTLALTLGFGTAVQAKDEIALSFALSPTVQDDAVTAPAAAAIAAASTPEEAPTTEELSAIADAPLPVPPGAENPPMSGDTAWPAGVYGGIDALSLGHGQSVQALLPAPPPAPAIRPAPAVDPVATAPSPVEDLNLFPPEEIDDLLALSLDLKPRHQSDAKAAVAHNSASTADSKTVAAAKPQPTATQTYSWGTIQSLFDGGTDSLVARAVGSAEGTRTPEGHKNPAYFGHTDPGNRVWNLGTFSYQHGAKTPEEADEKQLKRLQQQTKVLSQKAQERGLTLSPEELLNGIDLANQAPLAALDRGGYIDWLKEAQALGMTGAEAIVWARTRSFIDPDTQRWNAPGLGNNIYSISHDQERRANAIARAMNVTGFVAPVLGSVASGSDNATSPDTEAAPETVVEFALSLDLTDSFMQASTAITQSEVLPTSVSSSAPPDSSTLAPKEPEPPESFTLEADSLSSALTESSLADSGAAADSEESIDSENSDDATAEIIDAAIPAENSSVSIEVEPLQFADDALADDALSEAAIVLTPEVENRADSEEVSDVEDIGDERPELPPAWQPAEDDVLTHESAEMADIQSAIALPDSEGDSTADIAAAWAIAGTEPDWLSGSADQEAIAAATLRSESNESSPQRLTVTETTQESSSGFSPPLILEPMLQQPGENLAKLLEAEKANADRSKSQPISALSETLKSLDDFQKNEL
ncbi:MAG: hypothetical protein ACFB0G_02695 [Leptolyngbyaceae cyanobacterium]